MASPNTFYNPSDLNVLTRTVLFEKQTSFYRCRIPHDVPNFLWKKKEKELNQNQNMEDRCNYISKEILGPLLKSEDWIISPVIYNPNDFSPMRKVIFISKRTSFEITSELAQDVIGWGVPIQENFLKEYICGIWEGRNQNLNFR